MEFTGLDRIALLFNDIFPTVANRMIYRMAEEAKKTLDHFTSDELAAIEYKRFDDSRFSYSVEKASALVIDVEIPPLLAAAIWNKLQELDKQDQLTRPLVPIYDKFKKLVEGDEPGFA